MFDAVPSFSKPSLLFLCHRLPFPPDKGEKIRAFRILMHLARDFRIHLGCFIDDEADVPHVKALEPYCASLGWFRRSPRNDKFKALVGLLKGSPLTVATFASAPMQAWVNACLAREKPEAIFVYSSAMAQFVPQRANARLIMDFVDVDSDKWQQYAKTARPPMKWVFQRESGKLLAFDRRVAAQAEASIFVSETEADLFRALSPETAIGTYAVANGVDCEFFSPAHSFPTPYQGIGPHLVFTGTMDYRPNTDAVTWFAEEILPKIQELRPEATFTVAGAKPTRSVLALGARRGITVTGRTADIRPYIAAADIVVAPLRIARGIQNKVLEGMAMAKAVITTSQGLEGIAAIPGRHLVVADTPDDFATAVQQMTPERAEILGRAARRLMEDAYGWESQLAILDRLIHGLRPEQSLRVVCSS